MDQTLLFATVAIAVTMFALIIYIGMGVVKARESSANRLQSLTPTRSEVLSSGFNERAVAPLIQGIGRIFPVPGIKLHHAGGA